MILIGAYEGTSALSKSIQWMTRSPISHVSVMELPDRVINPGSGAILWGEFRREIDTCPVWEAWGSITRPSRNGVFRRTGIHEGHKPGTMIRLLRPISPVLSRSLIAYLDDAVGSKYDWKGLWRYALRINRGDDRRFFCSELAFLAFQVGGLELLARVHARFVAPGDIYRSPLLEEIISIRTRGGV